MNSKNSPVDTMREGAACGTAGPLQS